MDTQHSWLPLSSLWSALDQHSLVQAGLGLGILLACALLIGRLARVLLRHAIGVLGRQSSLHWVADLVEHKVFVRLAQVMPSLVVQFGLRGVPQLSPLAEKLLGNMAFAVTLLFLLLAISALLDALLAIHARSEHARTRSIKGYVQLARMILFVFGAIAIVATLIDRSPLLLLSGLGAMSAVILLVYKENPKNPEKTENLKTSIWTPG